MSAAGASGGSFEAVVAAFAADPRVEAPAKERGSFGSRGLRVDGKVFAMTVREALVVKLSRERVADLIASGDGHAFESGGRVMKEWVTVDRGSWLDLAREARRFAIGDADAIDR